MRAIVAHNPTKPASLLTQTSRPAIKPTTVIIPSAHQVPPVMPPSRVVMPIQKAANDIVRNRLRAVPFKPANPATCAPIATASPATKFPVTRPTTNGNTTPTAFLSPGTNRSCDLSWFVRKLHVCAKFLNTVSNNPLFHAAESC